MIAEVKRFAGLVRSGFPKTEEATRAQIKELPRIQLGNKFSEAEEFFIVLRNSIFPKNLSTKEAVYHSANGFFFKIAPVESNNAKGTDTISVERRRRIDDPMPLDILEITRNFIEPDNPKLPTNYSYRGIVIKNGVAELVSLKGKEARPKIEVFLASMTPCLETGDNPAGL